MKKILFITVAVFTASLTFAQSNNQLNLEGATDYVVLDNVINDLVGHTDFTIEFWIKADLNNNLSGPAYIFSINPPNGGPDNKMGIFMGNGTGPQNGAISFYDASTSPYYLISSTIAGDDSCHHIAYVKTGTTAEGFVDGISMGSHTVGYNINSSDRMSLGHEWDGLSSTDHYDGNIDDLRIWSVARTQSQIQANMHVELTGSEPNLIAYFNFNQGIAGGNNTGLTLLDDLTLNNNDGALFNCTLNGLVSNWVVEECNINPQQGKGSENAINFDGINDYVNLDPVIGELAGINNFTVEFWIKGDLNDNLSGPGYIFSINPANGSGDNKMGIFMGNGTAAQNGAISFYEANISPYYLVSPVIVGDNKCHHIAYVKTGTTAEGFIDGVSVGTQTIGYTILANDRMSIGHEWDGLISSDHFNGNIDELRIWNIARTPLQIQSNLNTSLTGLEPNLIGYYNFNQGVSGGNNAGLIILNDLTANNNDGVLNNLSLNGSTSNWVTGGCIDYVSINEYYDINVSIYPNPTHDLINIEVQNDHNSILKLCLIDMMGKELFITELTNSKQIDMHDYKPGVYSLVIYGDGCSWRSKVIKD